MAGRQGLMSKSVLLLGIVVISLYAHYTVTEFITRFDRVISYHEHERMTGKVAAVPKKEYIMQQLETQAPVRADHRPATNPVPTMADLERWPLIEIIDFFDGYIHSTQALCNRRIRKGKVQDGGWDICEDPMYKINSKDCLVYSFGINNDFSFDDAMETYGCEVHSYDPSMPLDDHIRGKKVHFHRAGIAGTNGKIMTNKTGEWSLYTLGTLRTMNGHPLSKRQVDIVKMDVEGAELRTLLTALEEGSLQDVRQLSFEMHINTPRSKGNGDPKRGYLIMMLSVLRGLWDMGFRLYHTNRNSNAPQLIYRSNLDKQLRTVCYELYMVRLPRTP